MIVLWIILGVLAFLVGLVGVTLYSKTRVFISYKDEKLNVKFQNGLIRYTLKQKDKKKEEKEVTKESIQKDVKEKEQKLTDKTSFLWSLFKEMRYRLEVKKTKIRIDFGTDDPADTGMLYGIIWAAIGNIYQIFNQYLTFDFPETEINPDFYNKVFKIEFYGIIKVRLVHIINALIKSRKGK